MRKMIYAAGAISLAASLALAAPAQAGLPDPDGHSFQTLSDRLPLCPVAFRRSTTSLASSTRAS